MTNDANARFIMRCKLTGNGAINADAMFIGSENDIEEWTVDTIKQGYSISDSTVKSYIFINHKLDERYLADD